MTLAAAESLALMGQPLAWDGYGRQPLRDVPDPVLRKARGFFSRVEQMSPRVKEQIEAITVVLEDREARSPQHSLSL
jgi:hypothetical protein